MAASGMFAVALLLCIAVTSGATFGQVTDELMRKGFGHILEDIGKSGLDKELKTYLDSGKTATLFLPRDSYYPDNVDHVSLEFLRNHTADLVRVLKFHIVPGKLLKKADLFKGSVQTLEGDKLKFSTKGKKLLVEQSPIRQPDAVVLDNVIAHGINGLLIPPAIKRDLPMSPPRPPKPPKRPSHPPPVAPGPAVAPAPGPTPEGPSPAPSLGNEIIEALIAAGYNSLVDIITLVGLDGYIGNLTLSAPITILAPNDAALNVSLTPAQAVGQNVSVIRNILDNHLIPDQYILYGFLVGKTNQYINKAGSSLFFVSTGASVNVGLTSSPSIQIVDQNILADDTRKISVMGINGVILPQNVPPSPQSAGLHLAPSLLLSMVCGFALFALL